MTGARRAFEHEGLRDKLMRHHGDNTDAMFWGWYEPWASPRALQWDMNAELAAVRCPVSCCSVMTMNMADGPAQFPCFATA